MNTNTHEHDEHDGPDDLSPADTTNSPIKTTAELDAEDKLAAGDAFGKVTDFAMASSENIYTGRDGSRSCAVCSAKVAVIDGLAVDSTVYARAGNDGTVTFEATVPRRGLTFGSQKLKDALLDAAETAIAAWEGFEQSKIRAVAILSGLHGSKGKLNRTGQGLGTMRLVKKPEQLRQPGQ